MVLYIIRNKQTGREYVGTTVRTAKLRWYDHLSACFTKRVESPLYADMRALGKDAFDLLVIEEVEDYESLLSRERALIMERRTLYPHGYNQVKGGRGNYGWVPSQDVRARMSAGQKGRVLSAETRAKISAAGMGQKRSHTTKGRPAWNRGLKHSEATKAKMRVSGARPWSDKERAGHAGLKRTDETRALIAAKKREWWASHRKG